MDTGRWLKFQDKRISLNNNKPQRNGERGGLVNKRVTWRNARGKRYFGPENRVARVGQGRHGKSDRVPH